MKPLTQMDTVSRNFDCKCQPGITRKRRQIFSSTLSRFLNFTAPWSHLFEVFTQICQIYNISSLTWEIGFQTSNFQSFETLLWWFQKKGRRTCQLTPKISVVSRRKNKVVTEWLSINKKQKMMMMSFCLKGILLFELLQSSEQ